VNETYKTDETDEDEKTDETDKTDETKIPDDKPIRRGLNDQRLIFVFLSTFLSRFLGFSQQGESKKTIKLFPKSSPGLITKNVAFFPSVLFLFLPLLLVAQVVLSRFWAI
jgi:hypothetical protein